MKNIDICKDISIQEMMIIIKDKNVILIDVRSVQEYREGHLRNAINIPLYNIKETVEKIINNKNKTIVLYCSAGIRSKKAANILIDMGYKNVYNVKEGAI